MEEKVIMSRRISETPILKGKDARDFRKLLIEYFKKPISKEERDSMKKAYEYFKSISNFEW